MQTFLPYKDFATCAAVLDRQRLGKQRVETLQILKTLISGAKAWSNHPAVKMWRGHEFALVEYGLAICDEWVERGYQDTCAEKMLAIPLRGGSKANPAWLDDPRLTETHRSNLIRKLPEHYRCFWPDTPDHLGYWWPVN
jgi:hypothetical protein